MSFALVGITAGIAPLRKPPGMDISDAFHGYSSNVGLFPLPPEKLAKARQWTRALQRQIHATWWAAVETDTGLFRESGMIPEVEAVMVEAGLTVAAIQVLHEIFRSGYPRGVSAVPTSSDYEAYAYQDPAGQVVSGLKLIRNGEMHADCVVLPAVRRVLGVSFDDDTRGFRVFPAWAEYEALPVEVTEARFPAPKNSPPGTSGKLMTNQLHHDHYRAKVGGEHVMETFLDALGFFLSCDPRIGRLDKDGELVHFPLEPIVERDYERRHPFWPKRREIEDELRQICESGPPTGHRRRILATLTSPERDETIAYCGYTVLSDGNGHMFTESPNQVARDIRVHGYEYWIEGGGMTAPLVVDNQGGLAIDPGRQRACNTPSVNGEEIPWREWFQFARQDAFEYRKQRRAE